MAEPKYTGPSALDEVLAKTDPRLGPIYRSSGFVDLPRYASQLGAGMVESATLGILKAPQEAQTTPEVLIRGLGHLTGSAFVPLGPAVKAAGAYGISKPLAGAAANVLATEIQTRGQADAGRLLVDGVFGAIFGKFYGPKRAAVAAKGAVVAREAGTDPLRVTLPETETSRIARMARETLTTGKPREEISTTYKQIARTHRDPDVRQQAKRIVRFWNTVGEGDVDIGDLKKAWTDSLNGTGGTKPLTMDHTLEDLVKEAMGGGELPLRMEQTGVTAFSKLRPPKFVMADVEHKTGGRIRAYTEIFNPAVAARRAASDEIGRVGSEVSNELRGVKKGKLQAMLNFLKVPESQRATIGNQLGLDAAEQARAVRVKDHIGKLWERNFQGESFDEYVSGILPRLENASPAQLEALRNHRTAGQMLQYAAASELKLETKDLGRFAAGHIRALSMMHHFDPTYRKLSGLALKGEYPPEFRDYLTNWLRGLRGTDSSFAKAFNPKYKKFLTSIGLDASDADVRNVVNTYTQLTHAGLLGFRPGPLIRNATNIWQTGSRVGLDWTWRGARKALTREGWAEAKAAGMVEEEVLHEVEGLRELGQAGAITKGTARVAETGLRLYGKIDDYNRSAMYLGMKDKFLTAAKAAGKNEETLLKKAGLYRYHPVVRDHVISTWRNGNLKEAAHLAGVHAAQDTQWVYQSGFRPTAMSGELNRAFLQFGVWPMNYLEYMRQMATLPMPAMERAKWASEWALGNAGIVGMFGAAGAAVGLGPDAIHHTLGWTGIGPLAYTGGPLFDLVKSAEGFMIGAPEQAAAQAKRTARDVAIGTIPGSGFVRDIARAKGAGAEMIEGALGEDVMKAAGMAYPSAQPSESIEEEMFRFMTGIRRTQ